MTIPKFNIQQKFTAIAIFIAGLLSSFTTSCNNTSTIGSELVGDEISIVVDSSFTITSQSVANDAVLSRTVMQLLGVIDAPDYGFISSDIVTQFMPAVSIDTTGIGINDIDSLKLNLLVSKGAFTGDSTALLGLEVYPLIRPLSAPIYSNFNPDGFYDKNDMIGSTVYNLLKLSEPDSLMKVAYHTISVDLPLEMARKFYTEFRNNPSTFSTPSAFAKFFPGLYIRNSYGSGRITRIGNTNMQIFYHQKTQNEAGRDTTYYKVGTYFAVTPEVITNNDITLNVADEIMNLINDGQTIMLAPAGYNAQIVFPAREIAAAYKAGTKNGIGVINRLTFQLPIEQIKNKYEIGVPADVVMVLKKDYEEFFLNNTLPDNITSFRATITITNQGTFEYVFSDMRQYIVNLLAKDTITDDDVTFVLVPVFVNSESNNDYYGNSTTTVTAVTPYVAEPKMGRILPDKAKINFVYSLQTTKF